MGDCPRELQPARAGEVDMTHRGDRTLQAAGLARVEGEGVHAVEAADLSPNAT